MTTQGKNKNILFLRKHHIYLNDYHMINLDCDLSKKDKNQIKKFVSIIKRVLSTSKQNGFIHKISDAFHVNIKITMSNLSKTMMMWSNKTNAPIIYVNGNDSKEQQHYYLAHMLGHLFMDWQYMPDNNGVYHMSKKNLATIKQLNNVMQVCGNIDYYNDVKQELMANYFAKQLVGNVVMNED